MFKQLGVIALIPLSLSTDARPIFTENVLHEFRRDKLRGVGGALKKHYGKVKQEKIKEELADVLIFSLLLAEKYGFDVPEMIGDKVEKNRQKYPVEKAKGTAKKYDEL